MCSAPTRRVSEGPSLFLARASGWCGNLLRMLNWAFPGLPLAPALFVALAPGALGAIIDGLHPCLLMRIGGKLMGQCQGRADLVLVLAFHWELGLW